MASRRPVRKFQQRAQPVPPAPPAPEPAALWTPPTPVAVARLGTEQQAAFDLLGQIAADLRRGQTFLSAQVAAARAHGVSWAVIGHALGTTGEAARQRWSS